VDNVDPGVAAGPEPPPAAGSVAGLLRGILLVINGALAGVGGVYVVTSSLAVTAIAAVFAVAVTAAVVLLLHERPAARSRQRPSAGHPPSTDATTSTKGRDDVRESPGASDDPEWAGFYRSTYPDLLRMALLGGFGVPAAKDSADYTMLQVHRYWSGIDDRAAYAHQVMAIDLASKRRPAQQDSRPPVAPRPSDGGGDGRQWLPHLLELLPATHRAAVERIYRGLSPSDLARALGADPVESGENLQLALARLTELLNARVAGGRPPANDAAEQSEEVR
jgi:DNA-directed RNA polymerase specialized sigma24 family protein